MVCSSHVKYICKKGDISVVKTEKKNKLVTCFCMESFKPSTVRHGDLRRRNGQEIHRPLLKISTGKDAFNPLTAE